ncbi:MAG: hypothetical protein ACE5HM_03440 [Acidiferrobacterales bacterium]
MCAEGLIVSDLKEDFVVSHRTDIEGANLPQIREHTTGLIANAQRWFDAERVPPEGQSLELSLDMRYVGQNFELAVPIMSGAAITPDSVPDAIGLRKHFFDVHDTAYGYHNPHDVVEIVNYRLTARGRLQRFEIKTHKINGAAPPEPIAVRPVYFSPDTPVESKVYERRSLNAGQMINGPAIIEQLDTTTPVYPGDRASVDAVGNIVITVSSES